MKLSLSVILIVLVALSLFVVPVFSVSAFSLPAIPIPDFAVEIPPIATPTPKPPILFPDVPFATLNIPEFFDPTPPPPTAAPTDKPTDKPTNKPTNKPTKKPTNKPKSEPTAQPVPTAGPTVEPGAKPQRFTGQEVTSFGPYLRDIKPQLTSDWYMATPIDLSYDGEQIYPLVASNAYIVGDLVLTISGGTLTADYRVPEGIKVRREFFTLFPSLDSMETIRVADLAGQNIPFKTPVDIAAAFGEDVRVIVYLNLAADFTTDIPGVAFFEPEGYKPWAEDMMLLLD